MQVDIYDNFHLCSIQRIHHDRLVNIHRLEMRHIVFFFEKNWLMNIYTINACRMIFNIDHSLFTQGAMKRKYFFNNSLLWLIENRLKSNNRMFSFPLIGFFLEVLLHLQSTKHVQVSSCNLLHKIIHLKFKFCLYNRSDR